VCHETWVQYAIAFIVSCRRREWRQRIQPPMRQPRRARRERVEMKHDERSRNADTEELGPRLQSTRRNLKSPCPILAAIALAPGHDGHVGKFPRHFAKFSRHVPPADGDMSIQEHRSRCWPALPAKLRRRLVSVRSLPGFWGPAGNIRGRARGVARVLLALEDRWSPRKQR
jgi:hypothetical protein